MRCRSVLRSSGSFLGALLAVSPALPDDCNGNGVDDIEEIAAGQAADCDRNFVPDDCDLRPVNPGLALWTSLSVPLDTSRDQVIGDIEGDGDDDIVLISDGGLRAYRSTPDGFEISVLEETGGPYPRDLLDFDGDGDPDLLATPLDHLSVHLNSGAGAFGEPRLFPLEETERYRAAADMTGDGLPEVILGTAPETGPPEIRLLLNIGGAFERREGHPTAARPGRILDGDLDGDGDLDLVATDWLSEGVMLFWNDGGSGRLLDGPSWAGCQGILSVADLDSDGDLDITARGCLLRNEGNGIFDRTVGPTEGLPSYHVAIPGDFDGDGDTDIVAATMELLLFVNGGRGRFLQPPVRFDHESFFDLYLGDFTGDRAVDLLARRNPTFRVYALARIAHGSDCNRNGVLDTCDTARRTSRDCNSNQVPDECELTPDCNGNAIPDDCDVDCNDNGIPEACEPFVDCNSNGVADSCDIDRRFSTDCNYNWIPDECERPPGDPCNLAGPILECRRDDCNGNLVHDACDRAAGWTLEECARPYVIGLGFRGPTRLRDAEGGGIRFEAVATLTPTVRIPIPPGTGVQGWSVSVVSEGCTVVSATTAGTAGAPESEGGYEVEGFNKTGVDRFSTYAYSAVALTTTGVARAFLPLGGGPYDIFRVTLEAERTPDGTCPPCELRYENAFLGGQPTDIVVTVDGESVPLETEDATLCPGFRRGDVNASARVDISDPIRLFMSLFLGAEAPGCMDGADANDDGLVNITDGIFLLQDLFRGDLGSVIPHPGPFACSPDPTGDALDCVDPGGGCP